MYNKYFVYVDDGRDVLKIAVPAISEEAAKAGCAGIGDVIAVKDVTERYPIDVMKVREALFIAGFGVSECTFMCRALEELGIAD